LVPATERSRITSGARGRRSRKAGSADRSGGQGLTRSGGGEEQSVVCLGGCVLDDDVPSTRPARTVASSPRTRSGFDRHPSLMERTQRSVIGVQIRAPRRSPGVVGRFANAIKTQVSFDSMRLREPPRLLPSSRGDPVPSGAHQRPKSRPAFLALQRDSSGGGAKKPLRRDQTSPQSRLPVRRLLDRYGWQQSHKRIQGLGSTAKQLPEYCKVRNFSSYSIDIVIRQVYPLTGNQHRINGNPKK
jgi:hypothetical protein